MIRFGRGKETSGHLKQVWIQITPVTMISRLAEEGNMPGHLFACGECSDSTLVIEQIYFESNV